MNEFVVFASKGVVTIIPAHECMIFQKNKVLQLIFKGDKTINICDTIVGCHSMSEALDMFSVLVKKYCN